jgi:hypothetical protein
MKKKFENIIANIIAYTLYLGYITILAFGAYGFYKVIDGIVLWLLA